MAGSVTEWGGGNPVFLLAQWDCLRKTYYYLQCRIEHPALSLQISEMSWKFFLKR